MLVDACRTLDNSPTWEIMLCENDSIVKQKIKIKSKVFILGLRGSCGALCFHGDVNYSKEWAGEATIKYQLPVKKKLKRS